VTKSSTGGGSSGRDDCGGGSKSEKQRSSTAGVPDTDHMTESSSEVEEVIIEEVSDDEEEEDEERREVRGGTANVGEFEASSDEEGVNEGVKNFSEDQDAYYRSPVGGVAKVRILSHGEDPNHPTRYSISLPDGSRLDNVRVSRLATLMDLTSKELSMLMKERNKRQNEKNQCGGRSHSKGRHRHRSKSPACDEAGHVDNTTIDEGYIAAGEGEPACSGPDQSLSNQVDANDSAKKLLALPPITPAVQMVEAKTEDGGTKMVPMYEAGMRVRYKNAAGEQAAEILCAHLDDLMEPYYDVKLEDGREKQTDNAHIMRLEPGEDQDEVDGRETQGDQDGEEEDKEETREEAFSKPDEEEEAAHQERDVIHAKAKRRHSLKQSLTEQVQNLQHLSDPASQSKANSSAVKDENTDVSDRSQGGTLSPKKKREPAVVASSIASTFDPLAVAALVQPDTFDKGDEVLYSSSKGDHHRAVVLRSYRDKKNRPYYVIRLPEAKEKQVYGHRLRLYMQAEHDGLRRSRSRSRGLGSSRGDSKARGRSSSKVSNNGRGRGHRKTPMKDLRRSESVDSREASGTVLSNSSGRSKASRERTARDREESLASARDNRYREESLASARENRYRDESLASSRGGHRHRGEDTSINRHRRTRDESLSSSVREGGRHASEPIHKRNARGRSKSAIRHSRSDVISNEPRSERKHRHGRERSRSRAPPSVEPLVESSSLRSSSSSHHHQFSSSHHHHAITSSSRSRPTTPGVSASSRMTAVLSDHHSLLSGSGAGEERPTKGRSISRLRNFRKSFAGRKKKQ